MIAKFVKTLALRYLKYDSQFLRELLLGTSTTALQQAFSNKQELTALLFKIRPLVVNISDEFPQATNLSHIEQMIRVLQQAVKNTDGVIVDLGAANGDVSADFLKAFPNLEFHLFEPLKESYTNCVQKFKGNPNVNIHNKAVGNIAGQTIINQAATNQSSSLLSFADNQKEEFFIERIGQVINKETIDVVRLNDYLKVDKPIWLLKLDLQGYEVEALKGADNLLKQTRFVLCEMMNHDSYNGAPQYHDIDTYLRSQGFKLLDTVGGLRRSNKLLEFDSIYYNPALISA